MRLGRRRALGLAALGLAGGGYLALRPTAPSLPPFRAREQDGLVFLDAPRAQAEAMTVGLPGTTAAAARPPIVDLWAALADPNTAPALGGGGVPTVVTIFDYRCGFCRTHAPDLWRRAEAGEIRLVWRDWPILGPASVLAARAAQAAWEQDAYLAFHQALMRTSFVPNDGLVRDIAERAGLDLDAFEAARSGPAVRARLDHNQRVAGALGVPGVPVYVVDRVVVAGGYDVGQLLDLSRRHRPQAR